MSSVSRIHGIFSPAMIESSPRYRDFLICLGLALATAAVYWPVQHFEFVNYDDLPYVYYNADLRHGLSLRGLAWAFTTKVDLWMPVTWLARLAEYQLFGLDAGSHHLVNLLFHIANALLLFGIFKRMTAAPWRSAFVAALFAVHPLHVESVAWITGLKDVLSMFFGLLTIWVYVRYVEKFAVHGRAAVPRGHPRTRSSASRPPTTDTPQHVPTDDNRPRRSAALPPMDYALTLLFFALALMAKPMMVTLPFVLLLLDYWPLGRMRGGQESSGKGQGIALARLVWEKAPFLILAAGSCAVAIWAQSGAIVTLERVSLGSRIANAIVSYVSYLGQAICPIGLAVHYPYRQWSWEVVTGAGAVLLLLTILAVWRASRNPQFLMGWLWYLGTLVPVIGLVQVGRLQRMADRYTYLPLVGLFIIVAWAVPDGVIERPVRKRITAVAAILLLVAYAVVCRLQVGYWENSETLFRHALKVTTNNTLAESNLAASLLKAGKIQEAISCYEQMLRDKPDDAGLHYSLGTALQTAGRMQEAIRQWEQAVRLDPDLAAAHNNLGTALLRQGKVQQAIEHYERALRIDPGDADVHYNLGIALERVGRVQEAIAHYKQAVRLKPGYADARNRLAALRARSGER
jgi:Flp pilus assembly protein TadD